MSDRISELMSESICQINFLPIECQKEFQIECNIEVRLGVQNLYQIDGQVYSCQNLC